MLPSWFQCNFLCIVHWQYTSIHYKIPTTGCVLMLAKWPAYFTQSITLFNSIGIRSIDQICNFQLKISCVTFSFRFLTGHRVCLVISFTEMFRHWGLFGYLFTKWNPILRMHLQWSLCTWSQGFLYSDCKQYCWKSSMAICDFCWNNFDHV